MDVNFQEHIGHYITALHEGEILVGRLVKVSNVENRIWLGTDHFPRCIRVEDITECSCGRIPKKEEGSKAP